MLQEGNLLSILAQEEDDDPNGNLEL